MNCLNWYSVTMHDVTIAEIALRVATRNGNADSIAYHAQRLDDIQRAYAARIARHPA